MRALRNLLRGGLQKVSETRGTAEYLLQRELGHFASLDDLAQEAVDLIRADRTIIKILGRSIESLTMQMKSVTDVTFERDKLKEENEILKERLSKYEES